MSNLNSQNTGTIAVERMITMSEACNRADPTIQIMSQDRKNAIAIALLKDGIGVIGHEYGNEKKRSIRAVIVQAEIVPAEQPAEEHHESPVLV